MSGNFVWILAALVALGVFLAGLYYGNHGDKPKPPSGC